MKRLVIGLALLASPVAVAAQTPAAVLAVNGAPVVVEITQDLDSATAKVGETFGLKLAQPLVVNGVEVLPAGLSGSGEVIDAKPAGAGGKPGRLVLAARYVEQDGRRIRLRTLDLSGAGENKGDQSLVVGIAVSMVIPMGGLASFAVKGGDLHIPAGARAGAKLGEDIMAPAAPPAPAAEPPAPTPSPTPSTAPAAVSTTPEG